MAVFPPLLTPDGESLILDRSRLLLGFALTESTGGPPRRKAPRAGIESALANLRLVLEGDPWDPDSGPGRLRINHTQWALWVRDAQGGAIDEIVIRVDAGALPREGRVELRVGDPVAVPDRLPPDSPQADCKGGRIRLLDPVRVETDWCGYRAVVTLQPGSEIALGGPRPPQVRRLSSAEVVRPGCVRLTRPTAVLVLARPSGTRQPMTLSCTYPRGPRRRYPVHVSRLDTSGRASGGVTMILGPAGWDLP